MEGKFYRKLLLLCNQIASEMLKIFFILRLIPAAASLILLLLGDSVECDREVCSIVSGEDEELKYLDVEPEHSKQQGGRDSREHRSHEPEIQNASQVPIEGIKEPTALINRLAAVSC